MINDNVLGERLNLFRAGEIEESSEEQHVSNEISFSKFAILFYKVIDTGIVFLRSLAYGFALKTVFATDWPFIGFLAIGFSLDLFITNIFDLFKK